MRLNIPTLILTAITSIAIPFICNAQDAVQPTIGAGYRMIQRDQKKPTTPFFAGLTTQLFFGVDDFRGIPDSDYGDNSGLIVGAQGAAPLPYLDCYGLGLQMGASYGAYDFAGRGFTHRNQKDIQSQGFVTFGFFKRPLHRSPWSAGLAYDVMLNKNFSIYSESPTLTQWRAQLACFFGDFDEFGLWASWSGPTTHKSYRYYDLCGHKISYRAVAQFNFFWRHICENNVETAVWIGVPFAKRLNRTLSEYPGKYIVGGKICVPFGDAWELAGRAQYVQPATKKGPFGSRDYSTNIAIEIGYDFGGNATKSPAAAPWTPYLPLANNSNFMVDVKTRTTLK